MAEQMAGVAGLGGVLALITGLIIVGAFLGVGALVLVGVQNQTTSQYMGDTWRFCSQPNLTAAGLTCGAMQNTSGTIITGNWTDAAGTPDTTGQLLWDSSSQTADLCSNTTGAGATDDCTFTVPYLRNTTAASEARHAQMFPLYINYSADANQWSYAIDIPDSCLSKNIVGIKYTKEFDTTNLYVQCNNSAGTWTTIATYTNSTDGITYSRYPTLAAGWMYWYMYNGTGYVSGGTAETFAPVNYSLASFLTTGNWLGTVVVAAIAVLVLGMVVWAFKNIMGGDAGQA
jgi:hypothetical protein